MIYRPLFAGGGHDAGGGWFGGTSEDEMFSFQAGGRSDNSTVEVTVDYGDIPFDLRNGITIDLERQLGRTPSEDKVMQRYEDIVLSQ